MKLEYFTPPPAAPRRTVATTGDMLPGLLADPADRPSLAAIAGVVGLASVVAFGVVVVLGLVLGRT